jgi:hypothetical protein
VVLTVKTGGLLASRGGEGTFWAVASTAVLGGLLLLPFGRRRRFKITLIVLGLMMVCICGVGCGGGSSSSSNNPGSATPDTFTINVTSTSSAANKTVPLVVNITP